MIITRQDSIPVIDKEGNLRRDERVYRNSAHEFIQRPIKAYHITRPRLNSGPPAESVMLETYRIEELQFEVHFPDRKGRVVLLVYVHSDFAKDFNNRITILENLVQHTLAPWLFSYAVRIDKDPRDVT